MKKQESLFREEGYQLMGAAFEVYNENGSGLLEEIYQESLELALRGIPFRSKQELTVFYKGRELQKRYIPDLHVFSGIMVELKAVTELAPEHEAQVLNYLRIARQPVGYLINFAHRETLQRKRFVVSEIISAD
jgi:GxxExxY protein